MTTPTIDACLIVRNERAGIKKCLIPVLEDRTIRKVYVHDTGSTDGTYRILQRLADKYDKLIVKQVEPIMWCTKTIDGFDHIDFSANRNRVSDESDADWLFVIDGDEQYKRGRISLHEAVQAAEDQGLAAVALPIQIEAEAQSRGRFTQTDAQPRLFKREACRWKAPIHNQLLPVDADKPVLEALSLPLDKGPVLSTSYKGKMAHRVERSFAATLRWHADAVEAEDLHEICRSASYAAPLCYYKRDFAQAEEFCVRFLHTSDKALMTSRGPAVLPLYIDCLIRRRDLNKAYETLQHAKNMFPLDAQLHRTQLAFVLADWTMAMEVGSVTQDGTSRVDIDSVRGPINTFIEKTNLSLTHLIYSVMREAFEDAQKQENQNEQ